MVVPNDHVAVPNDHEVVPNDHVVVPNDHVVLVNEHSALAAVFAIIFTINGQLNSFYDNSTQLRTPQSKT